MYSEQEITKLAIYLSKHGYTDAVDVNPVTSFVEYGLLRNPATGLVAYCHPAIKDGYFVLNWTRVELDDMQEAVTEMRPGDWSFVGSSPDDTRARLNNNHLAGDISAMNDYIGYFDQSCNWDATIEALRAQTDPA